MLLSNERKTPGGRICVVFECRNEHISRPSGYLCPAYLGEDESRFRWGRDGRRW
jgi:hypothetical protein